MVVDHRIMYVNIVYKRMPQKIVLVVKYVFLSLILSPKNILIKKKITY